MNAFSTVFATAMALFFLVVAMRMSQKLTRQQHETEVLWDQVTRYEAYIAERAAEDQARERAAIMN
jgi:hypothetical protein